MHISLLSVCSSTPKFYGRVSALLLILIHIAVSSCLVTGVRLMLVIFMKNVGGYLIQAWTNWSSIYSKHAVQDNSSNCSTIHFSVVLILPLFWILLACSCSSNLSPFLSTSLFTRNKTPEMAECTQVLCAEWLILTSYFAVWQKLHLPSGCQQVPLAFSGTFAMQCERTILCSTVWESETTRNWSNNNLITDYYL